MTADQRLVALQRFLRSEKPVKLDVPRDLLEKWVAMLHEARWRQHAATDCGSFFGNSETRDRSPAAEIIHDMEQLIRDQAPERWVKQLDPEPF